MVNSFIVKVLRSYSIRTVLRDQSVKGLLNFRVIDFIDKGGNYYSASFLYNESNIFTTNKIILIGSGSISNLGDDIKSCVKRYFTSDEYYEKRVLTVPTVEGLNSVIMEKFDKLANIISDISTDKIKVRGVKVFSEPALMVLIYFNYSGRRQNVLKLFLGQKNILDSSLFHGDIREYEKFKCELEKVIGGIVLC